MLVLTRKLGERICIGETVQVQVLEIHKGRVKLGFVGPPQVAIHRDELLHRLSARSDDLAWEATPIEDARAPGPHG